MNKRTLFALSLIAVSVPACAAETGPEAPAEHVGESESAMFTCWSNGQYICHPDLYVEYATSQVYLPGNPGNLYPGTYITYVIGNKGTAAAGPFTSVVTDYYGNVLKSQTYSGLPVGQTTSIFIIAPYYDGWTRTAIVDSNNEVYESNETNNRFTVQTGLSPFP
jgi:subtilase family serine protease